MIIYCNVNIYIYIKWVVLLTIHHLGGTKMEIPLPWNACCVYILFTTSNAHDL